MALDRTVDRIVELDGIHLRPQTYEGGYTAYRDEKARRWQRYLLDYEAQQKRRARWEADIAATKEHARSVEVANPRSPGLRRIARKVAIVRERRLRRQLDSAQWPAAPETRPAVALAFPSEPTDPSTVVLRARGLTVKRVFDDLDLTIRGGERVLVSGRNGAGKTTLLRLLAGELTPDAGVVHRTGTVGLLPQTHDVLHTAQTVLDFFRSRVPVYIDEAEALLDTYLFPAEDWDAPLRTLSAGELRRLLLAVLVNGGVDVLLLDEPTNYLDFDSLDVIEEALSAYPGTLVMVTHDAWLAERVGVHRVLPLDAAERAG
jgi:ATPase subunit of ABC transporter with duplicated ATPase domains